MSAVFIPIPVSVKLKLEDNMMGALEDGTEAVNDDMDDRFFEWSLTVIFGTAKDATEDIEFESRRRRSDVRNRLSSLPSLRMLNSEINQSTSLL